MKTLSKALAKGTIATVAAGAMVMGTATPALAQHRDRNDGIDAGDVIAGALIIGGIAAVVAAASDDDNRRYNDGRYNDGRYYDGRYYGNRNRGYDNRRYNRAGDSRQAVEQCVYAAQRNASRYSYGGQARVTDIRKIDRKRDGYEIKGRIAVNTRNGNWRRGWGNDYRGWNNDYRGYDAGTFECRVRYGQVVDLDYDNIRGLG